MAMPTRIGLVIGEAVESRAEVLLWQQPGSTAVANPASTFLNPRRGDNLRWCLGVVWKLSADHPPGSVSSVKTRRKSDSRPPSFDHPANETTVLRPFRFADYDAVLALWRRCQGIGLGASDTRARIVAYLRRNPGFSFVAQRNGKLVGAILGGHDGRRGYLHHLAVAKRHRRAGLGRQLVDSCLEKLREAGIEKCNIFVFAGNADGMKFWARTGWGERPDLCLLQVNLLEDDA
jgi:putative acetyltransferase